ncbi:histidinol-phosphate transaminase [Colwellia psychrerythraea]|uniref:Histidinol-phosphate aminotransferase n=1 Tax=Colwellia psychrerythraea TaxID=28229 RepID=A0A099KTS5_COLPS|nr:histidinol-phosphate transaminase [Colwellia psychrerythraea]KGJ93267.1 Histidinol-phosphate aminotransferase [Colwellia psychrerythraea]
MTSPVDDTLATTALITKLAREELVDMVPYQSARRLFASGNNEQANSKTWLNANEAPGQGQYQLHSENINRYPDFQPQALLNAYSNYCKLPIENILATRGADEGIELIIRSFCRAYQDNILICPPTYGMYAISAENHGAGIISVPLVNTREAKCQLDLEGLKQQVGKVKVVFLCSPGNPTGNTLPVAQIQSAIDIFKDSAIVVVDEAYYEYTNEELGAEQVNNKLISQCDNVIILRTLSKAFALAGLRCGFTLSNTDVITLLSKVIAPYPIAAPVAEIASKALTNDLSIMQARVNAANHLREQLSEWLKQQKWCSDVFESDANFVLFRCNNTDDKNNVFNFLVEHNILIRDQSKQQQLENCLRISIGSEEEVTRLKQLLETL